MSLQAFIGIKCERELKEQLEELASKENRKLSDYLRLILKQHVTQLKQKNPKNSKIGTTRFCKTCGATLPDLSLDYCPETYSCGNHLHVLGRPHSASLCAFCNFRPEVEFAVQMRKERWDWTRIRQHLLADHLDVEVDSIIQAAMLELGEIE